MTLATVRAPEDVRALPAAELPALVAALREEMIATVSKTGGHLASSLGAVELAIGLLRVFDPMKDRIVWDVGHQAYAWKMLTGRRDDFGTLRSLGGLSGFCNPEESPCDAFISGHAGNALAAAEGFAAARDMDGGCGHVVAVVGDASLANGESLEALCNCTSLRGRIVMVVNDNTTSTSRNGGSFARLLSAARNGDHAAADMFFNAFGMRYIGPVDGHDIGAVEDALRAACDWDGNVVVHAVTVKGRGFPPAERDPAAWHGVGPFDLVRATREEGHAESVSQGWSESFGAALCALARQDGRICALTAAMPGGTGLTAFAQEFPDRFFDVGICESLLVTFAAGLAKAGRRPVVAVYSAFLQRAIDQVMHDVCLLGLPVVFAIDRAGCVGADGRTHHGMFDIPMLRCLPNLAIMQPKDAEELADMLAAALAHDGPVAIRYPKGAVPVGLEGLVGRKGEKDLKGLKAEQLLKPDAPLQIWALGDQVPKALEVARILGDGGVEAGVVNARLIKPVDSALLFSQVSRGARIVTLENGAIAGGFGSAVQEVVPGVPVIRLGWPDQFIASGAVDELEAAYGLTARQIAERLLSELPDLMTP